eukprot:CAMPEP_0196582660 /NCGR_PEP_ID=MMETSP1081-20130531/40014_1 /TAXON_ID=36882 /ORGANISM="Pyramimonas amylifera, Strain CCMP720" /LENGTH=93 /DNA_ID=CAMNT_0041903295 /DNA_START=83 /DNA_END=364 /DNA_ORIENTATION=+
MSKQNNLGLRRKKHEADLAREKAAREKRDLKLNKTIEKRRIKEMSGEKIKQKKKGIKLKRNVVVKGIRIRSADDKKRIKKLLVEEAKNCMDVE